MFIVKQSLTFATASAPIILIQISNFQYNFLTLKSSFNICYLLVFFGGLLSAGTRWHHALRYLASSCFNFFRRGSLTTIFSKALRLSGRGRLLNPRKGINKPLSSLVTAIFSMRMESVSARMRTKPYRLPSLRNLRNYFEKVRSQKNPNSVFSCKG